MQLAVREARDDLIRPLHGQGGLAHPAGSADRCDRHRPRRLVAGLIQQLGQLRQLLCPADEVPQRPWQFPGHNRFATACRQRSRLGSLQISIGVKDLLVDLAQFASRLGAELVNEHAARMLVSGKRLRLPAIAVEGEHQQAMQALSQRMRGSKLPQLGDHAGVTAQVQVRVDACLERLQPHLRQPGHLPPDQRVRLHAGQRLTAPQGQGSPEQGGRIRPGSGAHGLPRRTQRRLEPVHIQLIGPDADQVTVRLGADPGMAGVSQRFPQPHHIGLQAGPRRRRRRGTPQRLDQFIDRHDQPGAQQQRGQQRPLLAGRTGHHGTGLAHQQRPEEAELRLGGHRHLRIPQAFRSAPRAGRATAMLEVCDRPAPRSS